MLRPAGPGAVEPAGAAPGAAAGDLQTLRPPQTSRSTAQLRKTPHETHGPAQHQHQRWVRGVGGEGDGGRGEEGGVGDA